MQVRLRSAAKARLIRWVKPKSTRLDRNAPDIVKTQWATGNKNALADLFSKLNFCEDRYVRLLLESFTSRHPHVKHHVPPFYNHGITHPLGWVSEPIEDHREQEAVDWTYHRWGMICRVRTQRWTWMVTALLSVIFVNSSFMVSWMIYYIVYIAWPVNGYNDPHYWSSFLANHPLSRQKIDGAKKRCKTLGDSHYRLGTVTSNTVQVQTGNLGNSIYMEPSIYIIIHHPNPCSHTFFRVDICLKLSQFSQRIFLCWGTTCMMGRRSSGWWSRRRESVRRVRLSKRSTRRMVRPGCHIWSGFVILWYILCTCMAILHVVNKHAHMASSSYIDPVPFYTFRRSI